jgi:hypothetical protein
MTDKTDKAEYVKGTIRLLDGSESQFHITRDSLWQQWGEHTDRLGRSVDIVEAMSRALAEDDLIASSNDEDDEPDAAIMTDPSGPLVHCQACEYVHGFPDNPEGWGKAAALRDEHNAGHHTSKEQQS